MLKEVDIQVSVNMGYYLKEGFSNLFKNKKSTIASLTVMVSTLFVFGIFLLLNKNIDKIIKGMEEEQGIEVFISLEANDEQVARLGEDIKKIDGVNTIKFKSKQEAIESLKEQWKDNPGVIDGLTDHDDFLPASYIITLTELDKNTTVQAEIEKMPNVKNIRNQDDIISAVVVISRSVKVFIISITVILITVSVIIISNTIKLSVYARRKEISIMKYVGASNGFIRGPFVIESVLMGIISVLICVLVIFFTYEFVTQKLLELGTSQSLTIVVIPFIDVLPELLLSYLALAIGIGIIGSSISMKRYLEV